MNSPDQITVRLAGPADADGIASVLVGCWPDDTPDPCRIASLIGGSGRVTLVAQQGRGVVGMVDAFRTETVHGLVRWELDLLAVAASARGQGTSKALLLEAVVAAPNDTVVSRALVRLGNRPAERAFAATGFVAGEPRALFTAAPDDGPLPARDAGFTRVNTFIYRGLWIERRVSDEVLAEARALAISEGRERVGAVLTPGGSGALLAERAGYRERGVFRWWTLVSG